MFYFLNVKTAERLYFHGGYENAISLLENARLDWVTMGEL
jgi:hypothetical protein